MESPCSERFRISRFGIAAAILTLLFSAATQAGVIGSSDKLTDDEKIELLRGLMSEYVTMKVPLARSKKPLEFFVEGTFQRAYWENTAKQIGYAAHVGDKVQLTKLTFQGDKILFDINGGLTSGRHWYDNVQMGTGTLPTGSPDDSIVRGPSGEPTYGTYLVVVWRKPLENLTSADVKKILAPIMAFDQHSAALLESETLSPEMQQAMKDKKVTVGMTRDQVKMILGQSDRHGRETKDDVDTEWWMYGKPPGKIEFITFAGSKVIAVKDEYAGLGGDVAQ
jgi:hypothetical protein